MSLLASIFFYTLVIIVLLIVILFLYLIVLDMRSGSSVPAEPSSPTGDVAEELAEDQRLSTEDDEW
ncbi:MAG: hypothetical protein LBV40_03650 [Methanomicrobiales archaeon]|jgi:uncharacterized membrane protein|nr:hypothetical protein [Methanomicrobiales archaeon]